LDSTLDLSALDDDDDNDDDNDDGVALVVVVVVNVLGGKLLGNNHLNIQR